MIIKTFKRFLLALSLSVPLLFSFLYATAQYQTARLFDGTNPDVKGYLEYLPDDYATTTGQYPIMVFLHGIGEEGNGTTQIQAVAVNGPPKIIAAGQWPSSFSYGAKKFKFIVISPQSSSQWQPADISYVINQVISIYGSRVDLSRIYLTGLSLGGGGVEDFLAQGPSNGNMIAAAVVCAGASYWSNQTRVDNIAASNVPLWLFHNEFDNVVNYLQSVQWTQHLDATGMNPLPKLYIYPGVYAHDSWSWTYDVSSTNPNNIYEWMLGYTRSGNQPALPVSNPGMSQAISLPATATLDGTGSTAPGGTIVSYQWTHINGTWGDVILNPNAAKTQVTFKNPGNYIYQLTVTDNNGNVNSSVMHVYVNAAGAVVPISNAGTTQTVPLINYGVSLNASGSSAPSSWIQSYTWTKQSGPLGDIIINPSQKITSLSFTLPGTYVYGLTITDGSGNFAFSTVTVIVQASGPSAPVSIPGSNQSLVLPALASLDGSGSTDASGSISSYQWTKVSGPQGDKINTPQASKTTISFTSPGTYVYSLTVTDNGTGLNNTANITLTVTSNQAAPVSVPGNNQTITLPALASLDGSGSTDASGTISSYQWIKVSGPTGDILNTPQAFKTTISFTSPGNYVYSLTVTDNGTGLNNTANITLTVKPANSSPLSVPGANQTITLPALASLDGSGSSDASGTISSYQWTKVSGPTGDILNTPQASKTTISFTSPGTYVYSLTVTDNGTGLSNSANISITVNPALINPVVNAGSNQIIVLPALANLIGSAKSSSGSIVSYTWTKLSGPSGDQILSPSSSSSQVKFSQSGAYTYQLTVIDNNNLSASATVQITVSNPNIPPIANAGSNQTITLPSSGNLDGSGSSASSGNLVLYQWTKISGPIGDSIINSQLVKSTVQFIQSGNYIYQLKVQDNNGNTASSLVNIQVLPASHPLPIASAGSNQNLTLPSAGNLNASLSSSTGNILSYSWVKLTGPIGDSILSPNQSLSSVTFSQAGSYTYQVTVTDNFGGSSSAVVNIIVNPVPSAHPAPFANAGPYSWITLPNNMATLNATACKDSLGTIVSYKWIKVYGPSGDSLLHSDSVITKVRFTQPGTYFYNIKVTNNYGLSSLAEAQIVVYPAPIVNPVVKIIGNQTLTLPNKESLDGSGSNSPAGKIVSYAWSQISGPMGAIINKPDSSKTQVSFINPGVYGFQLKIIDSLGNIGTGLMAVSVNPIPLQNPIANAGLNSVITLPLKTVYLNAIGSIDSTGSILTYQWSKVSGPIGDTIVNPNQVKTQVSFSQAGSYTYLVTVTDNHGLSGTASVQVLVNPMVIPNPGIKPPVSNPGKNQTISLPSILVLNGSGSNAPSGKIVSYLWIQTAGSSGAIISKPDSAITQVSFSQAGNYVFALQVKDNNNQIADSSVSITVNPQLIIPVPSQIQITFKPIPSLKSSPDTIILSAQVSSSTSPIISTVWKQISGPGALKISNPDSLNTSLSNFLPGTYKLVLLVTDKIGDTSSKSIIFTVPPFSNPYNFITDLKFYPNPVINQSTLSYVDDYNGTVTVNIYNMNGQRALQAQAPKTSTTFQSLIDFTPLKSGLYILEIISGKNTSNLKLYKN